MNVHKYHIDEKKPDIGQYCLVPVKCGFVLCVYICENVWQRLPITTPYDFRFKADEWIKYPLQEAE